MTRIKEPTPQLSQPNTGELSRRDIINLGLGLGVVAVFGTAGCSANNGPDRQPTTSPSPTEGEKSPEIDKDDFYKQVEPNHEGGRVIGNFSDLIAQALAEGDKGDFSGTMKKFLLRESAQRAAALIAWSHALGLEVHGIEDLSKITTKDLLTPDGKYLNDTGKTLHAALGGALSQATITEGVADPYSRNSGVDSEGNFGLSSYLGIGGNLRTLNLTNRNGFIGCQILQRCGQPTFPDGREPIGLPEVPTDNNYRKPEKPKPKKSEDSSGSSGGGMTKPGGGGQAPKVEAPPATKPSTKPSKEYTPPAKPPESKPSQPPVSKPQPTPPPETGSNPDDGGGNSGDPGGF